MGRLLGVDPGTRRIGVALSDPHGRIASPHETIEASDEDAGVRALARIVSENDVEEIVVGHPRNMDGSEGPAAERASALAARIADATGLPVTLWDERLSSVQAERSLIAQGARRKTRKGATDRVAAALILQGFLDARNREGNGS